MVPLQLPPSFEEGVAECHTRVQQRPCSTACMAECLWIQIDHQSGMARRRATTPATCEISDTDGGRGWWWNRVCVYFCTRVHPFFVACLSVFVCSMMISIFLFFHVCENLRAFALFSAFVSVVFAHRVSVFGEGGPKPRASPKACSTFFLGRHRVTVASACVSLQNAVSNRTSDCSSSVTEQSQY